MDQKTKSKLCKANCLNGTVCLNRARNGDYCWKHRTVSIQLPTDKDFER